MITILPQESGSVKIRVQIPLCCLLNLGTVDAMPCHMPYSIGFREFVVKRLNESRLARTGEFFGH